MSKRKLFKITGLACGIALCLIFLACLYEFLMGNKIVVYEKSKVVIALEIPLYLLGLVSLIHSLWQEI